MGNPECDAHPSVRSVLERHAQRRLSSRITMVTLGIETKGDLIRALNQYGLEPPLGDVETSEETVREVVEMIRGSIAETGGFRF